MTERTKQAISAQTKQAGVGGEVTQIQHDIKEVGGQVAGTVRDMQSTRQRIQGDCNQAAGRDIINNVHLTFTSEHRSAPMTTANFDQELAYGITEEQHTNLYHAKHLLAVLDGLSMVSASSDRCVDLPRESLSIVFGMARDLVEKGTPGV